MTLEQPSNKVALITGSAKRIGKEIAEYLHSQNYEVIVHYNTSEIRAKEFVNALNNKRENSAIAICANLSKLEDIKNLAQSAIKFKRKINLLINNASLFTPNDIKHTNIQEWDDLFESTVKGCYFLTQFLIPYFEDKNSNVINILDTHYKTPRNSFSLYSMAKAALAMQTKSFALELAPKIRVNGIALGHFKWPEYKKYDHQQERLCTSNIPLRRSGNYTDIHNSIKFIIKNSYLTGEIIHLDGGKSLLAV